MRKKRKRRKQGSEDSAISSVNGKKVNEMEYVYAAMLLHSAGKTIDEKSITGVTFSSYNKPEADYCCSY